MLQTQTVNPTLLRILKALMKLDGINELLLVGGTSLALQMGHRESIDIDLFGVIDFDYNLLKDSLSKIGETKLLKISKNINILTIEGVKVDFVNYNYPWIVPPIEIEGIRMAGIEDIAAMKLNAIAGRGTMKDFIDLYFILKQFSFKDIFNFYNEKYSDGNIFLIKKSLMYFEDAERNTMPNMASEINWKSIKFDIIDKFKTEGYR